MGRIAGLSNDGVQKGAWTSFEDQILTSYVQKHGEGKWRTLPMRAGLKRCGKSCRLRWLNYLKPGIKRGNISREEDDLIIKLHTTFGNRWSLIAGQLPGRTDNEIKNYWNTTLQKRLLAESSESSKQKSVSKSKEKTTSIKPPPTKATPPATAVNNDELPENFVEPEKDLGTQENSMESETHEVPPSTPFDDSSIISSMMNFDMEELWTTSYSVDNDFWQVYQNGIQADNDMISEDHDFFLQPYDFQALEPYDFQALELFLHEEEDGCDYTGCV